MAIDNPYIPPAPPAGHPAARHHAMMVSTMKKITDDPGVSSTLNQTKSFNRHSPFSDFRMKDAVESHPAFPKFQEHRSAYDKEMKHTPTSKAQSGHS